MYRKIALIVFVSIVFVSQVASADASAEDWEKVSINLETIKGFNNFDKILNSAIEGEFTIAEFNFVDGLINCHADGYNTVGSCMRNRDLPLRPSAVISPSEFGIDTDEKDTTSEVFALESRGEVSGNPRYKIIATRGSIQTFQENLDDALFTSSPGRAYSFVVNPGSGQEEVERTIQAPDFSIDKPGSPVFQNEHGESFEVRISNWNGGSTPDKYTGVSDKQFFEPGEAEDMVQKTTSSSPGNEKAVIDPYDQEVYNVRATVWDNTPTQGDAKGLGASKTTKVYVGNGFTRGFTSDYYSPSDLRADWELYSRGSSSEGWQDESWGTHAWQPDLYASGIKVVRPVNSRSVKIDRDLAGSGQEVTKVYLKARSGGSEGKIVLENSASQEKRSFRPSDNNNFKYYKIVSGESGINVYKSEDAFSFTGSPVYTFENIGFDTLGLQSTSQGHSVELQWVATFTGQKSAQLKSTGLTAEGDGGSTVEIYDGDSPFGDQEHDEATFLATIESSVDGEFKMEWKVVSPQSSIRVASETKYVSKGSEVTFQSSSVSWSEFIDAGVVPSESPYSLVAVIKKKTGTNQYGVEEFEIVDTFRGGQEIIFDCGYNDDGKEEVFNGQYCEVK